MRINSAIIAIMGVLMVIASIFVFAQQAVDISQMASLLQSLQEMVQNLAKKVQEYVPIVFASVQETDLTQDGKVGENDWLYMKARWFSNDASADINGDGIVNSIDFGLVNKNWGKNVE